MTAFRALAGARRLGGCLALLALVCLLAVVSAGPARAADDVILIGYAGALTGSLAPLGLSGQAGFEVAVAKINAGGGIGGKKIVTYMADDSCSGAENGPAVLAANDLLGKGVRLVVGHTCSGATGRALAVYGDKAVVISPSATAVALTEGRKFPNFFRSIARDDAQSKIQAAALKGLGLTKIAVLHDGDDYGQGMAELTRDAINSLGGMEVVLFEGVTPGRVDHTSAVRKVIDSGAQALMWGGYYPEAAKMVNILDDYSSKIVFIGGDGVKDDSFIKAAGNRAEGVYAIGPAEVGQNPLAAEAVAAYKSQTGEENPGFFFFNAIAAVNTLASAIEKTGDAGDLAGIKRHLASDMVETPLGAMKYNEQGDVEGVGFKLYKVAGGKFVEQPDPEGLAR